MSQRETMWAWRIRVHLLRHWGRQELALLLGLGQLFCRDLIIKQRAGLTLPIEQTQMAEANHSWSPLSLWTQRLDIWQYTKQDLVCYMLLSSIADFFPKRHHMLHLSQCLASQKGRSHTVKEVAESLKTRQK